MTAQGKPPQLDNERREKLVTIAREYFDRAYAPYSHYHVGAALLSKSGEIFGGCNIENVSHTPTVCAERTAVFKAVSEGHRQFIAIAVVTENAGSPCGVCRQVLFEFAPDILVIIADSKGNIQRELILRDLLPDAFGPSSLPGDE